MEFIAPLLMLRRARSFGFVENNSKWLPQCFYLTRDYDLYSLLFAYA